MGPQRSGTKGRPGDTDSGDPGPNATVITAAARTEDLLRVLRVNSGGPRVAVLAAGDASRIVTGSVEEGASAAVMVTLSRW